MRATTHLPGLADRWRWLAAVLALAATLGIAGCASPEAPAIMALGDAAPAVDPSLTPEDAIARAVDEAKAAQASVVRREAARHLLNAAALLRYGLAGTPREIDAHERYQDAVIELAGLAERPEWRANLIVEYEGWWALAGADDPDFAYLLARVLERLGDGTDHQRARRLVDAALEGNPEHLRLRLIRGRLALARAESWLVSARAKPALGQPATAAQAPPAAVAAASRDALEHLRRVVKGRAPEPGLEPLVLLGDAYAGLGRFETAVYWYVQAVEATENPPVPLLERLALALVRVGEFHRAQQVLLAEVPAVAAARENLLYYRTVAAMYWSYAHDLDAKAANAELSGDLSGAQAYRREALGAVARALPALKTYLARHTDARAQKKLANLEREYRERLSLKTRARLMTSTR